MNASPLAPDVVEGWEGRQLLGISIGSRLFGDAHSALYRAWETSSNRPLRLRIQASLPETVRSAEQLQAIQHPHLYPLHRCFEHAGELFVTGPELAGHDFERFAASRGPCGEAVARALLRGAAQGWWVASVHGCPARLERASLFVEQPCTWRFDPFGLGTARPLPSFAPRSESGQLRELALLVSELLLGRVGVPGAAALRALQQEQLDSQLLELLTGLVEQRPQLTARTLVETLTPSELRPQPGGSVSGTSTPPAPSRLPGILLVVLLAGVAAAFALATRWPATQPPRQAPPPSSSPQETAPLTRLQPPDSPSPEAAPSPPVAVHQPVPAPQNGWVADLLVVSGARVEAGTPLAIVTSKLAANEEDKQLAALEARLQTIGPELERAEAEHTRLSLAHNEAQRWATLAGELRTLQLRQLAELELHLFEVEGGAPLQGYSSLDALRQVLSQADQEAERLRSTTSNAEQERDRALQQVESAQKSLSALHMERELLDLGVVERRRLVTSERIAQRSYVVAPGAGSIVEVLVRKDQAVRAGDPLFLWQPAP